MNNKLIFNYSNQEDLNKYHSQLILESMKKSQLKREKLLSKLKEFDVCTQEILECIEDYLDDNCLVDVGNKIENIIKKNNFNNKFNDVLTTEESNVE